MIEPFALDAVGTALVQVDVIEGVPAVLGTLRALLVAGLIAVGSFFLTVGTLGVLRLPNVYNRLHATSKSTTLGAASIFLAAFVYFGPQGTGLVSLVGIVFLFITAPTGAHMISRAAGKMGVPFQEGVVWPVPEHVHETPDARTEPTSQDGSTDDTDTDTDTA